MLKKYLQKCHAKLNLYLDVKGTLPNGYHELDMIMVPIELHDSLFINELKTSVDSYITVDDYSLIGEKDNIVTAALRKVEEKYILPKKLKIIIHKRIPVRAGLGGGSSNAGNMIVALNQMYNLKITKEEMKEIALSLGADVPFFLNEKPSRCQGIGEVLTPIKIKNTYHCIIVCPSKGCSTEEVYKSLNIKKIKNGNINDMIKGLEEGDDELIAKSLHNDLEKVAIGLVPEIADIKSELKKCGINIVMMTGSGSCVFGLSQDKKIITNAAKKLENKYRVEVTKTIN